MSRGQHWVWSDTSEAFPANSQLLGQRSLELGQRLTRAGEHGRKTPAGERRETRGGAPEWLPPLTSHPPHRCRPAGSEWGVFCLATPCPLPPYPVVTCISPDISLHPPPSFLIPTSCSSNSNIGSNLSHSRHGSLTAPLIIWYHSNRTFLIRLTIQFTSYKLYYHTLSNNMAHLELLNYLQPFCFRR